MPECFGSSGGHGATLEVVNQLHSIGALEVIRANWTELDVAYLAG